MYIMAIISPKKKGHKHHPTHLDIKTGDKLWLSLHEIEGGSIKFGQNADTEEEH